ncbi:phage holin family protein [Marinobacter daepoensis]|uniref:Phage holin family protein n=1 Tax=Marinobacter daepoensis TaxID=262077 RepID=A0ABS3BAG5_9GAMM|nr:phage holin family protein [Marinobacter daepoensis]MBY6077539.1 phage holin family protein [Marinobacter daepoensis]
MFGGGLAYLGEVKNGSRKWDLAAFTLSVTSAGFFAFVTYMICIDLFKWTPGLSVACSGMVAHLGAEKVKQLLTDSLRKSWADMAFGLKAQLAVGTLSIAVAFGAGWTVKGWFEDSKDLAATLAQQSLADEIRAGQAAISRQVEQRLSELRANERIIDRGVIREIQKSIYQRVCFEPELVRLLNAAARGESPGEPDDQGAGGIAADD